MAGDEMPRRPTTVELAQAMTELSIMGAAFAPPDDRLAALPSFDATLDDCIRADPEVGLWCLARYIGERLNEMKRSEDRAKAAGILAMACAGVLLDSYVSSGDEALSDKEVDKGDPEDQPRQAH